MHLFILIPYFLNIHYNKKLLTSGLGIGEHINNYQNSDDDFIRLRHDIDDLFKNFDLGLYKSKSDKSIKSDKWEDYYDLLSREEAEKFLSEKENWIWHPNKPGYFIAEKEGSNKVEEYFNKENF